jgi:hypothetical protein
MTSVEFVDNLPGRTVGRRDELVEFAAALKDNPGRWGKYPRVHSNHKSAYSCASAINHDKFNALKGPHFEATARKESGEVTVYVRYNPDKDTGTPEAVEAPEVAPEPQEVATSEEPTVSYSYPGEPVQEAATVS